MMSLALLRRVALSGALIGSALSLATSAHAATATFTTTIPDTYWCPYDEATKTTVPAACDTVKVILKTNKDSYTAGETVSVTGDMYLLNTKSGSNNLLTYYASGFAWELLNHRYYITATLNGITKDIFRYPYGSSSPEMPPYTCSKLGGFDLPYCLPSGTATFTAPTTPGTYTVSCSAFIGQGLYQTEDAFTASIPPSTCKISITVGGGVDLTAGPIAPTTAVAGTAQAYSTTINNIGGTSTSAGFYNFLQRADAYSAATDTATNPQPVGNRGNVKIVSAGGSVPFTFLAYTFPLADAGKTRYLRACADMSAAGGVGGAITETNEANNCGPWTAIAVTAAPAPDLKPDTPTYAPTGSPTLSMAVTFSAVVHNLGTGSISGVPNTFVVYDSTDAQIARVAGNSTSFTGAGSATVTSTTGYQFPAVGTYTVRLIANSDTAGAYQVVAGESNMVNNISAPVAITIAPDLTKPNLKAGDINETTATVGTPISFTASVRNEGTNGTPDIFWVLLQIADNVSNNVATGVDKFKIARYSRLLAVGGSGGVTFPSHTFAAAGTKHFRVCADMTDAGGVGGNIDESNEGDNCGNWTALTISPVIVNPPPPGNCDNGATDYPTCTSCTAPYELVGEQCVIVDGEGTKPTVSISADPLRVKKGSSTTLTWTSTNADTCVVTNNRNSTTWTGTTNPITPPATMPIDTQTIFTARCTKGSNAASSSVTVNILPDFTEF